ncbi:MAG TPA: hypothetical protein VL383_16655 [Gemmatimonadaceae bacterium]|nr:hypothetical protein [Gemmatimonadaceae bacterium]
MCRHVLSDEPRKYVDDDSDQGFDRRVDGCNTMQVGYRGDPVQANAVVARPTEILQGWMRAFRAGERPGEQGSAPGVAH